MNKKEVPVVSIAITTYNRANFLKESITSVLNQDYEKIEVLIVDNASDDETPSIVQSFNYDPRIKYFPSDTNIGMINNWNRAIRLNSNPYLVLFQDDDIMLPGFVTEIVQKLDNNPQAGFGFSSVRFIDSNGKSGALQDVSVLPPEYITDGFEYLHAAVSPKGLFIHSSAVMFRASALKDIGGFDSMHDKHAFAYNLHIRLAVKYDVVAVHKELVNVRLHKGQVTEGQWRSSDNTGPLGFAAERVDALAYLLDSPRATDKTYRKWLNERLLKLNAQQSYFAYSLLPNMYWSWEERLHSAIKEIEEIIPINQSFILIDDGKWLIEDKISKREVFPFSQKNGVYWGSPLNDTKAIEELKKYLPGIKYLIVGWPAFWWLEHYTDFNNYLEKQALQIYKSSRLIFFTFRT